MSLRISVFLYLGTEASLWPHKDHQQTFAPSTTLSEYSFFLLLLFVFDFFFLWLEI